VLRALARDPDKRYPNAQLLQGELEDFAHENRLRISPLVLARLMGTLFPERIEEWTHAKAQGAFFVEQHVVRTLIEAGKTPDPNDPETVAMLKEARARNEAAALAAAAGEDDDTTTINHGPPPGGDTTTMSAPPSPMDERDSATMTAAPPPIALTPSRSAPPAPFVPGMPGAVPIMATPGTLVSSSTVGKSKGQLEREAAPRLMMPSDPTVQVRTTKRKSIALPIVGAALAIGGGVATLIAIMGGGTDDKQPAATETKAEKAAPVPAPDPTPTVTPIATPEPKPAPEPAPEVKPEPPAPAPKAEPEVVIDTPAPEPKVVKRAPPKPRPKPESKPEPKETKQWSADSPFMPVRTDKH